MKVLLVEDDHILRQSIDSAVSAAGCRVVALADGAEALRIAGSEVFDAAIVDRMLPGLDGLAIVRSLRTVRVETPVLLLTALGAVRDRVEGLEAGADDYLVKPFSMPELIARVQTLARRPKLGQTPARFAAGDLELDLGSRTVSLAGAVLSLQPREFDLLACLMRHAGHVVTRAMLLEQVWRMTFDPRTNIVESHISRLRAKIDRPGRKSFIETVRGEGYRLAI